MNPLVIAQLQLAAPTVGCGRDSHGGRHHHGQRGPPAAATQTQGAYSVTTAGSAFSLTESFTMGDAVAPIGTGVDVSAGIVADMPAFGSVTTQSGGVAGSLAGTITSAGVMTLTAGGAGTTATGQFVSEISVE